MNTFLLFCAKWGIRDSVLEPLLTSRIPNE